MASRREVHDFHIFLSCIMVHCDVGWDRGRIACGVRVGRVLGHVSADVVPPPGDPQVARGVDPSHRSIPRPVAHRLREEPRPVAHRLREEPRPVAHRLREEPRPASHRLHRAQGHHRAQPPRGRNVSSPNSERVSATPGSGWLASRAPCGSACPSPLRPQPADRADHRVSGPGWDEPGRPRGWRPAGTSRGVPGVGGAVGWHRRVLAIRRRRAPGGRSMMPRWARRPGPRRHRGAA